MSFSGRENFKMISFYIMSRDFDEIINSWCVLLFC